MINTMDLFELARQAMEVSFPSAGAETCDVSKCAHCGGKMLENFENMNILNQGGGRSAVANPFREGP